MQFTIACPNCDAKLKATETLVGKTVKCPRCSKAVPVQEPQPTRVTTAPRMELEEEPVGAEYVDDEPAVDELPEVDDEDIADAEYADAADDDYDVRRRRPKRRPSGGVSQDDRMMAMLMYVLGLFTGIIGPLILWIIKKDQSKFIDHHGKEVVNFSITMIIISAGLAILGPVVVFATFGLGLLIVAPLVMAVGIYGLVVTIIGAVRANQGQWWEFPLSIRFIQ